MDRRTTPFNGRIAHVSLRGKVAATAFTEGRWHIVTAPLADLRASPAGPRDRQVVSGDRLLVLDRRDGHAFGQLDRDGYVGWLSDTVLAPDDAPPPTHAVAVASSHLYSEPRVQAPETAPLHFGARLRVTGQTGSFAETPNGHVPAAHLRPLDRPLPDPLSVAALFLGTPYLWGGNSRLGIDCSGLVQAALLACGIACPGDSDQQAALGHPLSPDTPESRGDLVFWKGHVALVSGPDEILHATAHGMTTRRESLSGASARIAATGGGPVTQRRRLAAADKGP